jgi:tripartite-type tricarboxylate transporter receptor subunit TctC
MIDYVRFALKTGDCGALGAALGQQIVVDNRGGAGGIIAMEAIASRPP